MKISKSMLAAGAVTTVAVASLAGLGTVSAQSNGNGDGLVDKIATTFGLNNEEVQAVFDEQKAERQVQKEENRAEHLQELVDNGTITTEQRDALETKKEEMKAAHEALKDQDLTREEMRENKEQSREEFQQWAEEQGIDLESIKPEGGKRGGHGPKGQKQQ